MANNLNVVKRIAILIISLGLIILILGFFYIYKNIYVVDIAYTSDLHSHFTQGLKEYLRNFSDKNHDGLIMDGGDFVGVQTKDDIEWNSGYRTVGFVDDNGRILVKFSMPKESENPTVRDMGESKYFSTVLGNHEIIENTPQELKKIIYELEKRKVQVLSGNIYLEDGSRFVKPYIIKDIKTNQGNLKLAIIGLTTNSIRYKPEYKDGVRIRDVDTSIKSVDLYKNDFYMTDLVEEANSLVEEVKSKGADLVIVTMHSGMRPPIAKYGGNRVQEVATKVPGVDVILAGHTHQKIDQEIFIGPDGRKVIVSQPEALSRVISTVKIIQYKHNGKWQTLFKKSSAIDLKEKNGNVGSPYKIYTKEEYEKFYKDNEENDPYISFTTFKEPKIPKEGRGYTYEAIPNKFSKSIDDKIIYKFKIQDYDDYKRIFKRVMDDEKQ